MKKNHTILGASGAVGRSLAATLQARGLSPRLVTREAGKLAGDVFVADLGDPVATRAAMAGADVVHFAVGLPYVTTVWQEGFPRIVRNVLAALEGKHARLVFLDNVYMYGPVDGPMTEQTPHAAKTKKGATRKTLVDMLAASRVEHVIARSADFYGPGATTTSLLDLLVLANLRADKPPMWLGDADRVHSFTYVPDIARAMADLADADGVAGSAWHIPTAPPKTVRELVRIASARLGRAAPELGVLDRVTIEGLGRTDPVMQAVVEMFYQYDRAYEFDTSAYETRFGVTPTSYEDGLAATLASGDPPIV